MPLEPTEFAPCSRPGCPQEVPTDELCGCDRDPGPLCMTCCEKDHPAGLPIWMRGDAA